MEPISFGLGIIGFAGQVSTIVETLKLRWDAEVDNREVISQLIAQFEHMIKSFKTIEAGFYEHSELKELLDMDTFQKEMDDVKNE